MTALPGGWTPRDYLGHGPTQQAFVVSQAHGTWGKAVEVPGTAALNKDGLAGIGSLSCASPAGAALAASIWTAMASCRRSW